MTTKITNGKVLLEDGVKTGVSVVFSDGKIIAVGDADLPCDREIDAAGKYVSPGFIDLHTHGGGGADFMDGTPEAFIRAARLHAQHGTTTLLPTATSGDFDELLRMEEIFLSLRGEVQDGADMPGLHLEGPYFSPAQCGAQDPAFLRLPDPSEYTRLLGRTPCVLRWSAAPELPGAAEFARTLRAHGVLPSIGHSDATFEEVQAGYEAGFTHITHLYSCMSTVHRRNAYRFAGVVESAYLIDGMTAEIIADGVHLPPALLRFAYRFKGAEKLALVTDSMRGAGCPDGESILGSLKNGRRVLIEDGVAKLPDRTAFAGSVATMDRLVRNMLRMADVPLVDAVRMATRTPAGIMGFSDRGVLRPGARADIVIFDDEINVSRTIVGGRSIYAKYWEEK